MPLISIVVPCYNEQESLPIFLKELDGVVRITTRQTPAFPLKPSSSTMARQTKRSPS